MTTAVHGALLDVHGVGVVLLGRSGVGKSECALELIHRGHRLVADDVIERRFTGAHLRPIGSQRRAAGPAVCRHDQPSVPGCAIRRIPDDEPLGAVSVGRGQ